MQTRDIENLQRRVFSLWRVCKVERLHGSHGGVFVFVCRPCDTSRAQGCTIVHALKLKTMMDCQFLSC